MQGLSSARPRCAVDSSAGFESVALLWLWAGSAGHAHLRAWSTLPRRSAVVGQRRPTGPLEGLPPFFRVLESEQLCTGPSRARPSAGSRAALAGRSRRELRSKSSSRITVSFGFLPSHNILLYFLTCVSGQLPRIGAVRLARPRIMFPSGFQCHRAAMQSIGEENFWISFSFDSFRYSRDFWGGGQRLMWFSLPRAHTMVLRIGAALAASCLETVVYSPPSRNEKSKKEVTESHSGHRPSWAFRGNFFQAWFFLSPPFPRPLPLGKKIENTSPMSFWATSPVGRALTHEGSS